MESWQEYTDGCIMTGTKHGAVHGDSGKGNAMHSYRNGNVTIPYRTGCPDRKGTEYDNECGEFYNHDCVITNALNVTTVQGECGEVTMCPNGKTK